MTRFGWVAAVVASVVFFLHYVVTFMSWSVQPGHVAPAHANGALVPLWPVLSFPLFAVLPSSFVDLNWAVTMLANSGIWAGAVYAAVSVLLAAPRRRRSASR